MLFFQNLRYIGYEDMHGMHNHSITLCYNVQPAHSYGLDSKVKSNTKSSNIDVLMQQELTEQQHLLQSLAAMVCIVGQPTSIRRRLLIHVSSPAFCNSFFCFNQS